MAFKDYTNHPLMPYLLPIIPKGALLSPKTKLTDERIGKIPGMWTPEGWVGFKDFTEHVTTPKWLEHYDNWFKASGHEPIVGMLAEHHIGIDVDCEDQRLNEFVAYQFEFFAGATLIRYRENSNRISLIYRLKPGSRPITKRKLRFYLPGQEPVGKPHEIEILGKGQQWLIEGKHPSGVDYDWQMGRSPQNSYEDIPELDYETLEIVLDSIKQWMVEQGYNFDIPRQGAAGSGTSTNERDIIGPNHHDLCPDLDLLKALLAGFPATSPELADRDEWVKFLMAVKAACGGSEEFYEDVVVPWNLEFPGLDEEYLRERWESFYTSSFGWTYLLSYAGESPEVIAAVFDDEADMSQLTEEDKAPPPPTAPRGNDETTLADTFVKLNARKRWMIVMQDDKLKPHRCNQGIWEWDAHSMLHDIMMMMNIVADGLVKRANTSADMNASEKKALYARASALRGVGLAQRVMQAVKADRRMYVRVGELDARDWILGFKGGYVDRQNVIHEPDPSLLITHCLPYAPDF